MLLSADDPAADVRGNEAVCQHCGGATEFRPCGDLVAIVDDERMVSYEAFCVTDCVDFQQSGEAVARSAGNHTVWESRY